MKDKYYSTHKNCKTSEEVFELLEYFQCNNPIEFDVNYVNDKFIAVSKNFKNGSIVTSGINCRILNENIEDAILTSFEVPFLYFKKFSKKIKFNPNFYVIAMK